MNRYYDDEKPTEKQIDFATEIAETVGDDLPDEYTKEAYHDFISKHIDEFYEIRNEIRYSSDRIFHLRHSYVLGKGFNGDKKLNANPWTV